MKFLRNDFTHSIHFNKANTKIKHQTPKRFCCHSTCSKNITEADDEPEEACKKWRLCV